MREAVHESGKKRILREKVLLDEMLDTFHSAWDRESKGIAGDIRDMTALGERCIFNHMRSMDRDDRDITYSGSMRGRSNSRRTRPN